MSFKATVFLVGWGWGVGGGGRMGDMKENKGKRHKMNLKEKKHNISVWKFPGRNVMLFNL
jgi:hypothetical protein